MKNLSFTPVTLDGRSEFYELWHKTPRRSLDYSLPNIWGWQQYFGLQWAFDGDLCWLRQTVPFVTYWAPVGDWDAVDWAASGIDACRIGILDITDETLGNVVGLGMADTCSRRVVERMSRENTYPNSLTSTVTCLCKIPMYFDTQKETIQATIKMTPAELPEEVTMIRIASTLARSPTSACTGRARRPIPRICAANSSAIAAFR